MAAVDELDEGERSALVHRGREPGQSGLESVVKDPKFACPALAVLGDVRGARDDDSKPALGAGVEPVQLLIAERSVRMALPVGHRGQGDPIARASAAAERHRLEELLGCDGHGAPILGTPSRTTSRPAAMARPSGSEGTADSVRSPKIWIFSFSVDSSGTDPASRRSAGRIALTSLGMGLAELGWLFRRG